MLIIFNIFTVKFSGFLIILGGIEMGHWLKICVNKIWTFCISHSKAENLMRIVHQKLKILGDGQGSFSNLCSNIKRVWSNWSSSMSSETKKEWFQFTYILVITEIISMLLRTCFWKHLFGMGSGMGIGVWDIFSLKWVKWIKANNF